MSVLNDYFRRQSGLSCAEKSDFGNGLQLARYELTPGGAASWLRLSEAEWKQFEAQALALNKHTGRKLNQDEWQEVLIRVAETENQRLEKTVKRGGTDAPAALAQLIRRSPAYLDTPAVRQIVEGLRLRLHAAQKRRGRQWDESGGPAADPYGNQSIGVAANKAEAALAEISRAIGGIAVSPGNHNWCDYAEVYQRWEWLQAQVQRAYGIRARVPDAFDRPQLLQAEGVRLEPREMEVLARNKHLHIQGMAHQLLASDYGCSVSNVRRLVGRAVHLATLIEAPDV